MEFKEFDENECMKFIRSRFPESERNKYDDDAILYVVDFIWDYYEKHGMLSLNNLDDDDELLDREDLIAYCKKMMKDLGAYSVDDADMALIVNSELDYEESLEDAF